MKANFNPILPHFSLHIPLRSLYCIFNCSYMLLWSTVIQITQIQLSTNIHFWVMNWKPHIEIFPERPPCIYAIWLTEVMSCMVGFICILVMHLYIPIKQPFVILSILRTHRHNRDGSHLLRILWNHSSNTYTGTNANTAIDPMIPHNAVGSDMPLCMYHVVRIISGSLKPEILLMAVIKDVASLFPS